MKAYQHGDKIRIDIPLEIASKVGLKDGVDVEFTQEAEKLSLTVKKDDWKERLRSLRDRVSPLPEDYKFNRDEANER